MDSAITPVVPPKLSTDSQATSTRLSGPSLLGARVVWFIIIAATVVLTILGAFYFHQQRLQEAAQFADALAKLGLNSHFLAAHFIIMQALLRLVFIATALLIFWRRSDDWMAIFVSIMLVTWGSSIIQGGPYPLDAGVPSLRLLSALIAWIGHSTFLIFLYIMPDGKFIPRWTAITAAVWTLWVLAWSLFPTAPFSPNSLPDILQFAIFLIAYLSGLAVQMYRSKHYYNEQQIQQVKWITLGLVGSLVFGYVLAYLPALIFPALSGNTPLGVAFYQLFSPTISSIAVMLVPISIAFSIQRFRLWDVDFVINRGLVYGALTIALVALFAANTFAVQWFVRQFTGQGQSPVAFALSAVVIGVTFQPVRTRLQTFIDRTFYGINVDYRRSDTPGFAANSLVGTHIGPYEVLEPIGRGGMAEVYRGVHPTLGRSVAIKVLPPRLAGDADFRHRFEREAQTIAALRHPNIVQVYDFGNMDGMHYMVMEYISGQDLATRIRSEGRLSLRDVRQIISDVAGALDYAHEQGVIHRDVKPSNVMLQPATGSGTTNIRERAILTDFGIAKMVGGNTGLTKTGMMGTLDYIAPEQIRASKEVDGRADVYALGVMAYQMLTGQLPFTGDNPGAILIAHMQQPAPDPRKLVPTLPASAAAAILQALAKEPEVRCQTAGAFASALEYDDHD